MSLINSLTIKQHGSFLRTYVGILLLCLLANLSAHAKSIDNESKLTKTLTYTLGPLKIDKMMGAMHGPVLKQAMNENQTTINKDVWEAVWIKSFQVEVANGISQPEDSSLEFLCHAWLTMGTTQRNDERLLTVSQGMAEMRLPEGFGIRLSNLAEAAVSAQALNDNNAPESNVTYHITVKYITDLDAQEIKLKNLRTVTAAIRAEDAAEPFLSLPTNGNKDNKICAGKGVSFLVPPGRHEYITKLHATHPLSQGGIIHAIKLHLHAYGESMSLVDETAGKTLWQGKADNAKNKALITHVDDYNSSEGIELDPTHRFAVKAVYNNPTKVNAEAMAVLRIYIADTVEAKQPAGSRLMSYPVKSPPSPTLP
jgi:hypothetical protein